MKMKKGNDVFKELGIKQKTIDLFSEILKELAPPPKLTIDQWADKYRILSSKSSAEPGRWSTDRAPYQQGQLQTIPYKLAPLVIGIDNLGEIQEIITNNINSVLLELSEYDRSKFLKNKEYVNSEDEEGQ